MYGLQKEFSEDMNLTRWFLKLLGEGKAQGGTLPVAAIGLVPAADIDMTILLFYLDVIYRYVIACPSSRWRRSVK